MKDYFARFCVYLNKKVGVSHKDLIIQFTKATSGHN